MKNPVAHTSIMAFAAAMAISGQIVNPSADRPDNNPSTIRVSGNDGKSSSAGGHFGTDGFGSYDPMSTPLSVITNYFAREAEQIAAAALIWNRTLCPMGGQFSWSFIERMIASIVPKMIPIANAATVTVSVIRNPFTKNFHRSCAIKLR